MMYILVALWGLALGSFTNALVWRFRELEKTKSKKKRAKLSVIKGRSMCPSCGHELNAVDLIPVLGWLQLKGKCRYCKKAISIQYPLVEVGTMLVFLLFYYVWPTTVTGLNLAAFVVWLLIATVVHALVLYDFKYMELPDKLVAVLSGLAVVFVGLQLANGSIDDIANSLVAAGFLFGIFYAIFQLSGGKWIGGGDVKAAPAIGLLAGSLVNVILLLFIASLIGTIIGLPLIMKAKSKMGVKLPFGPLLFLGLYIVFFYGQLLIDWYLRAVGLQAV